MQQFKIGRRVIGKGKAFRADYKEEDKYLDYKQRLKDKRVLKEVNYFKTLQEAEKAIARDKEKDEKSKWGEVFRDSRIVKLNGKPARLFVAYKYRKY